MTAPKHAAGDDDIWPPTKAVQVYLGIALLAGLVGTVGLALLMLAVGIWAIRGVL